MLLGFVFLFLNVGFGLMVVAWVMMLAFLRRYPMPAAQSPADGWTRWRQFMKGYEGCPPEGERQRKLIATMFQAALVCFALMIVMFFAAGGPDALPPPPAR